MFLYKSNFKSVLIILILLFLSFSIFAFRDKNDTSKIEISALAGPSLYPLVGLNDNYSLSVLKAPNEAVAHLLNGESDYAILPSFMCFNLINKGQKINIAAVTGIGNLSIITSDKDFNFNDSDSVIHIPSKGSTPDFIINYLYPNVKKDYSYISPLQLSSMLIEGKVKCAVLPEPYTSIVLKNNSNYFVLRNVQSDFKSKSNIDSYPISLLVTLNKKNYKKVLKDIESSYNFVMKNIDKASDKIYTYGFISKENALETIPLSGICFISGNQMKNTCDKLYDIIKNTKPDEFKIENLNGFYL